MEEAEELLASGLVEEAESRFTEALNLDWTSAAAKFALKALFWWKEKLSEAGEGAARASRTMELWKPFYRFLMLAGGEGCFDNAAFCAVSKSVRRWVSLCALQDFAYNPLDMSQSGDWLLQFQLGLCHKWTDNKAEAARFLRTAVGLKQDKPALLFEFADVKALLGEEKEALPILRYAFLKEPLDADIYSMESALFRSLYEAVRERGFQGDGILLWMPVWGRALGVFTAKRALNQAEENALRASVFELENELKAAEGAPERESIVPRLINCYLWLAEHYEAGGGIKQMRDTMLKIKLIDESIYKELTELV